MPRSGQEARLRLRRAAIDLFLQRGFDAVTTAEIAQRAGVTERTYFRHFPDKREVLFDGQNSLVEWLTTALADVPADEAPLAGLLRAFHAVVPMLEANRPLSEPLAQILSTTPALRERYVAKGAHLVEVLTGALLQRGVEPEVAALAANTGWVTLAQAMHRWMIDPAGGLKAHLDRTSRQLHSLVDLG